MVVKNGSDIVPGKDDSVAKAATIDVDMKGENVVVNSGDSTKDKANPKYDGVATEMSHKDGKDGENKKERKQRCSRS